MATEATYSLRGFFLLFTQKNKLKMKKFILAFTLTYIASMAVFAGILFGLKDIMGNSVIFLASAVAVTTMVVVNGLVMTKGE